jgi:hypothetical protein
MGIHTLRLLLLLALAPTLAGAQHIELTPTAGFRVGGNFEDYWTGDRYDLKDDWTYGICVGVDLDFDDQLEFMWSRQDSRFTIRSAGITENFDLSVEYFHLGIVRHLDSGRSRPYLVGSLGATHANPDAADLSSDTRFSLAGGGGIKMMATDHLGIRLEGRVYATLMNGSGAIFCGPNGCSVGVSAGALWQAELRMGIVFGLGQ